MDKFESSYPFSNADRMTEDHELPPNLQHGEDKLRFDEGVPSGSSRSGTLIKKCPGVRALTSEVSVSLTYDCESNNYSPSEMDIFYLHY
ncbi:hypothetical protein TNIN_111311 [Trichonephila inaurata madagascariensis]|uniref:Uncharacterized protein n=1 Tax=Trichonephila inaurata madagascariensis TaxID=2747483 RepID=A0A8X7CSF9_9ARAC|nr:hypothetical protein TNIN_111311 [Trichonephila inaurata madagascariensis]